MKFVWWSLKILKYHFWVVFEGPMTQKWWFSAKKMKKVENLEPSRHCILIDLAVGENQKWFHCNIEEINSTKKNYFLLTYHDLAIGIWSLDRILTQIIGFRIQILPKCRQKVQLEHFFSQRFFRVRQNQNILGPSTRRAFFISEEI